MRSDQPSQTALRIAGNNVAAARDPLLRRILVDPDEPYSRWFVQAHSRAARVLLGLWSWGPTRRLIYRLTERSTPGGPLYLLLRKRYVDEAVRQALAAGAEQVVLLGAGLDPISLRLSREHPDVRFFEIDHPNTQQVKREALERHGALPANVHLLPVDFTHEKAEKALTAHPEYHRKVRTVFVAEGVLMYLERDAISDLFRSVRRLGAAGSTFLFTMLDAVPLADESSAVARSARLTAGMGEPLRSAVRREDLGPMLEGFGYELRALADHETLRKQYLEPLGMDRPVIEGELIVTATSR